MKKLILMVVLAVMATGLFALDLGGIKGTWQDAKWDADWTFSADGHIVLSLTSTGEKITRFHHGEYVYLYERNTLWTWKGLQRRGRDERQY